MKKDPKVREIPHSESAEAYLLACCLMDSNVTMARCISTNITDQMFYSFKNSIIYGRMMDLFARGIMLDLAVLTEDLMTQKLLEEVGGLRYLMEITSQFATTGQVPFFIDSLKENYYLREVINTAASLAEDAYNYSGEGISELVGVRLNRLFEITSGVTHKAEEDWAQIVDSAEQLAKDMIQHKGPPPGATLPTGIPGLDALFGAPERGQLMILGGLPSTGKSTIARQLTAHWSVTGLHGLFVTLEVKPVRVVLNLAQMFTRVGVKVLPNESVLSQQDFLRVIREMKTWGLTMSRMHKSFAQIRARAKALAAQGDLAFIVIDHGGLLTEVAEASKDEREVEIGRLTAGLKNLATELNCLVLLLWQLNRGPAKDRREPVVSDLRGSGALEADADKVWLIQRPSKLPDGTEQPDNVHTADLPVYVQNLIQGKGRDDGVATWTHHFVRDIAAIRPLPSEKPTSRAVQNDLPI